MKPCMCRPYASPSGCQISPCGPGEDVGLEYVCQCTEYFQPCQCGTLACDNGTTTYGTSCPSSSYSSSYYPSASYPTQSYAPTYYPTPSNPTPFNPSSQYGYEQPSHSSYSSYNLCNQYCVCEPYLPADCTHDSIPPIIGGTACACNENVWLTGCTLKPCQSSTDSFCECTSTNQPLIWYSPRCSSSWDDLKYWNLPFQFYWLFLLKLVSLFTWWKITNNFRYRVK